MTESGTLQTRCLSSLSKVFADEELRDEAWNTATALWNERYSFQVAFRSEQLIKPLHVALASDLGSRVTVRAVGLAPAELPCRPDHDEHVLRTTPGLYPDPLYPIDPAVGLVAFPGQWRSVWITVDLDETVQPGHHEIEVSFKDEQDGGLGSERFDLDVIPVSLPRQELVHTEWLHTDCIANYYAVEVWSDEHWKLIDQFVRTAVRNGINMILTPIFTPPLDTAVGGERRTVQLVDVERRGGEYRFEFARLTRWIELCRQAGVEYFEFAHFFTQWGARHAPKIMATEEGRLKRIFGWETDATGEGYRSFLDQFLPRLVAYIREQGLEKRSYFHVSDEPRGADMEQYRKAAEILGGHLEGFPIIDALSDYELFAQGAVKNPIPANDHIKPFIENRVRPLWTYYCVAQNKLVSNRFFHMPSARNRVLGTQLYKYGVAGLLHWGYNFYNAQYSTRPIDPFRNTDAGHAFPSGDPFIVYPGERAVIESLRLVVLHEGLQDMRALRLLESFIGRDRTVPLMEQGAEKPITFSEYPRKLAWLLGMRERVNDAIRAHSTGAPGER